MHGPIASAVILPDELVAPVSPSSHKRRQSSISETDNKRIRLQGDEDNDSLKELAKPTAPVRPERGRERRLFGAALGALSQNSATAAQKRRSEIEKRQQAQRRQQDEESEQRNAERLARRKEQRWVEQKQFDRASMRTRHVNLRAMANFLRTETEPRLYYRPWETTSIEDDCIQNQTVETEKTIKREVEEYETRQQQVTVEKQDLCGQNSRAGDDPDTFEESHVDTNQDPLMTNGGTNSSAHSPDDRETKNKSDQGPGPESMRKEQNVEVKQTIGVPSHEASIIDFHKDDDDENGEDVVEEAAEDTVIY